MFCIDSASGGTVAQVVLVVDEQGRGASVV
jgi:hypothetical protein